MAEETDEKKTESITIRINAELRCALDGVKKDDRRTFSEMARDSLIALLGYIKITGRYPERMQVTDAQDYPSGRVEEEPLGEKSGQRLAQDALAALRELQRRLPPE